MQSKFCSQKWTNTAQPDVAGGQKACEAEDLQQTCLFELAATAHRGHSRYLHIVASTLPTPEEAGNLLALPLSLIK